MGSKSISGTSGGRSTLCVTPHTAAKDDTMTSISKQKLGLTNKLKDHIGLILCSMVEVSGQE